mmetsp:Transcript_3501/g.6967  ORF Transcript_3501/g.6967 Transcript_3501/m.6967 type:complete len:604 (-) Transcript_3501:67-1878(-)
MPPASTSTNNKNNGYSSIPTTAAMESEPTRHSDQYHAKRWHNIGVLSVIVLCMVVGGVWMAKTHHTHHPQNCSTDLSKNLLGGGSTGNDDRPVVPWGVNLASWLSLEDYFFVGDHGAIEVATDWGHTAATCFPPLYANRTWQSETDLLVGLAADTSVAQAINAFSAYRNAFIDLHNDLPRIAAHGMRAVRVSVSWCLTDADPTQDPDLDPSSSTSSDKTKDETLWDRYSCLDPFYADKGETVRWPAVPKILLINLLKACDKYGLKAVLDIHTYAGGTSIGTFSGVWPRWSLFWQHDQPENPTEDFGRRTLREFFAWVESLAETDPDAFAGLGGITPMNEPGHLAGIFGPGSWHPDKPTFIPNLPDDLQQEYLHHVLQDSIPAGPHLRVLKWQSDAVELFRQTKLPQHMDLNINVHESILTKALTDNDENDVGGRHPAATQLIATWWKHVTTATERAQWAVLDMHHYHAWEPQCQGTTTGHDGSYTCGDVETAAQVLRECSSWAQVFRNAMDEPTARLSSGEFSASTHHSVLESCVDTTTLTLSYHEQVQAAQEAAVDLYFWTWKMPYGGAFRPAWSWTELMYRLTNGEGLADESIIPCGGYEK